MSIQSIKFISKRQRTYNKRIEKILTLPWIIYKYTMHPNFFQNNGINAKHANCRWLPLNHIHSLLIQHPKLAQQQGFVNIYSKLQEYIGVPNSLFWDVGGVWGDWRISIIPFVKKYDWTDRFCLTQTQVISRRDYLIKTLEKMFLL